jgi:type II secretory pathway component GspD/PulD (secretin)
MRRFHYIVLALAICTPWGSVARCQDAAMAESSESKPTTVVEPKLAAAPAEAQAEKSLASADDVRLTFNFRYQPWQDVLEWFADQNDLSLLMESPPPGTFNYRDSRSYTPAEALDVLNGVLLTKGYTLVRRERMLVVINLDDGIPPNLVPDVPLDELDSRGEYELIRVLFPVWNMTPEQAAEEIQPLLGPQGKVVTLPQARQVQVTEVGGRLRTIRSIVNAVEQPGANAGMREFELKYVTLDTAMPTIRQMLGIPTDAYSTPDDSLQITRSATGEKLLFRGTAQNAKRLEEVLRLIDVPEAATGIEGAPQLEVYSLTQADPDAVEGALKALLGDDPTVRISSDDENGFIVAIARPSQQATIRATIDQMQKEQRQVDVIQLSDVDPQTAVMAISKLFGGTGDEPDPKAPRVDADITSRSLMIRGTTDQIAQIRALLRKMGETEEGGRGGFANSQQHVRLLPLTGAAARSAITQIEQIWPSVRANHIRVVTPSSTIPTYRPSENVESQRISPSGAPAAGNSAEDLWQIFLNRNRVTAPARPEEAPGQTSAPSDDDSVTASGPKALAPVAATRPQPSRQRANLFRYAADELDQFRFDDPEAPAPPATPQGRRPLRQQPIQVQTQRGTAPVLIAPGPGGTLIASDDLEALDQLEELLSVIAGRSSTTTREYAVFYLKYSKAANVSEVLAAIFGGRAGGNDRGLIGDMANNALGNMGGALMGDLLLGGGGSSGGFSSGTVNVIPDARLNALIVHARPADLDTIEQLLKVLDQRTGPEDVEAETQPRPIPVFNTEASKMAEIIQQVYADRMANSTGVMSPQEMMRMIRGGQNVEQQIAKMSVAVDIDNNLLIVRAPDPLFDEVKAMVENLDQARTTSPETTQVMTLKVSNGAAMQRALASILPSVESNANGTQDNNRRRGDDDSLQERQRRAMRRQWEMIREMRRAAGDRNGGGRGDRGGDGGGFRGRGGFRPPGGFGGRFGGRDGGGSRGRGGDRGRGRD